MAGSADGLGAEARFSGIKGLVLDRAGQLFATDYASVRRITPAGLVTTLAGHAVVDYLDGAGSLYVADSGNHKIRKLGYGTFILWEPESQAVVWVPTPRSRSRWRARSRSPINGASTARTSLARRTPRSA